MVQSEELLLIFVDVDGVECLSHARSDRWGDAGIIEYNWGVSQKHRFESFCYGPKNCKLYKMGKPGAVPYKDCGSCYDDGYLDELCTENRDWDE